MGALQDYFDFVMEYAPYFYYIPGSGVDPEWGRGPAAAAHAIDFLYECYYDSRFVSSKADIYDKIVALADYLLSIQCTNDTKEAYGGFQSKDGSSFYYSIDAHRAIPALLKAYDLTGTIAYFDSAVLAGGTFLFNMQHRPSEIFNLGSDAWQPSASADDCEVKDLTANHPPWDVLYGITVGNPWVGYSFNDEWWGLGSRYPNVGIPKGAIITSAVLRVNAQFDSGPFPDIKTRIQGQLGNADVFSSIADYNARPRTNAITEWNAIGQWFRDSEYDSPDISAVIQEIVDGDWEAGNALAIFFEDNGTPNTASFNRVMPWSYDSSPTKAPKLMVSWKVPLVHDKYYGGFAQWVDINDNWGPDMWVVDLYGLIGLKELYTRTQETKYQTMLEDMLEFYREGIKDLWLYYKPPPNGDGAWHRAPGVPPENLIYDDDYSYALHALYLHEGWSETVEKVFRYCSEINSTIDYPAYQPAVGWPGYLDVVNRKPDCAYYDAVTSGILALKLRKEHDGIAYEYAKKIVELHSDSFMYWGPLFTDYSPVENKKSVVTVSWLGLYLLKYSPVSNKFTQILNERGENLTFYSVIPGETESYAEPIQIKAIVNPTRSGEIFLEPGYVIEDYITAYVFAPLKHHDKLVFKSVSFQVIGVQQFRFQGDAMYTKAFCRRLIT